MEIDDINRLYALTQLAKDGLSIDKRIHDLAMADIKEMLDEMVKPEPGPVNLAAQRNRELDEQMAEENRVGRQRAPQGAVPVEEPVGDDGNPNGVRRV